MNIAKSLINARTRNITELKFEVQNLTSYGGLVVFQKLFEVLDLPRQLRNCCRSLEGKGNRFYSHAKLLQILIVHLLVGSRKLREMDYYREDPVVCEGSRPQAAT